MKAVTKHTVTARPGYDHAADLSEGGKVRSCTGFARYHGHLIVFVKGRGFTTDTDPADKWHATLAGAKRAVTARIRRSASK